MNVAATLPPAPGRDAIPTRPVLRWHGGKWRLAPWIIGHFPPHRVYVEPYGGAASVLLRKPRSYSEVWNDMDGGLVNLFRVLRDDALAGRLIRLLRLTPFARGEFEASYQACDDPVEQARRLIVRSMMGFGSDSTSGFYRTGWRDNTTRKGTTPASDWAGYPDVLAAAVERMRGVNLDSRPAIELMARHDGGGGAPLCRPSLFAGDSKERESSSQRSRHRELAHLRPRAEPRRACRTARLSQDAEGHGGALRLSLAALRRRPVRRAGSLAAGRAAGARRWCATPNGGSLDQSGGRHPDEGAFAVTARRLSPLPAESTTFGRAIMARSLELAAGDMTGALARGAQGGGG